MRSKSPQNHQVRLAGRDALPRLLLIFAAMRTIITLLVATLSVAACSRSHEQAAAPPAAAEQPRTNKPALLSGMGNHHHPIAAANADAQRYFDQGFNFVFGFNHEEAARAFTRAA